MRWVLLVLVLAGCSLDIFGPDVRYVNRRPLAPVPDAYAGWYAETEDCLGVRGDFDAVRWSVADSIMVDGVPKVGTLDFPNDITMFGRAVHVQWALRHEAAHHITGIGDDLHDARGQVPCSIGTE